MRGNSSTALIRAERGNLSFDPGVTFAPLIAFPNRASFPSVLILTVSFPQAKEESLTVAFAHPKVKFPFILGQRVRFIFLNEPGEPPVQADPQVELPVVDTRPAAGPLSGSAFAQVPEQPEKLTEIDFRFLQISLIIFSLG
jgi:hypothetical protein